MADTSYKEPSLDIYQDFLPTASAATLAQRVGVIAPHYGVHTNAVVGEYDPVLGLPVTAYPDREEADSVIDTAGAALHVESAALQYLDVSTATAVTSDGNTIELEEILVSEGANSRDAALGLRDVAVGDLARITVSSSVVDTKITGLLRAAAVASEVGSITKVTGTGIVLPLLKTTASGTYTGDSTTDYILTVVTGGTISSSALESPVILAVTTTDGSDGYPSLSFASTATENVLANCGLTLKLAAGAYVPGDVFKFTATASTAGAIQRIRVNQLIPVAAGGAITRLQLGAYVDPFQVDAAMVTFQANSFNMAAAATEKAYLLSASLEDYPIMSGIVTINYRERLSAFSGSVYAATPSDYLEVIGDISILNPLGAMVAAAIAGGQETVYFTSVASDDLEGYADAAEVMAGTTSFYSLVPATMDPTIIQALMTTVEAQSAPSVANYRILWYGLADNPLVAVATRTSAGGYILGTASGSTVTITSAVDLTDIGVEVGDILYTEFSTDSDGNSTHKEYTVLAVASDSVQVNGTLSLAVPVRMEFWRNLNNTELIESMRASVSTTTRRGYAVYCDGLNVAGITNAPSYIAAAMAAGRKAGSYPQAPQTNLTYAAATVTPRRKFTKTQYNRLASRGVFLLVGNDAGAVYNRHQLSTDMSDLKTREQSYTTAVDFVSIGIKSIFSAYHGKSNISDDLIRQLSAEGTAYLTTRTSDSPDVSIGSTLESFTNFAIRQDTVVRDHLWMTVDYNFRAPFNFGTITQRVL